MLPPYARGHAGDAFTITAWGANTRSRGNLVLVDESSQEISSLAVRQTLQEAEGKRTFKEPKTPKSRRVIALPTVALEVLRQHRARQAETKLQLGGRYNDHDLVCTQADGSPWWSSGFDRAFRRAKKQAGIDVRFHDLRHTHATQLLRAGVHPKVVSERLGHASIGITLDTYSHVMPGMQEEAVRQYEASLAVAWADAC